MSCDPNLCQLNKLAKLRRHASQVHFASNSFGPIHFVFEHFNPLGHHPSDLVLHLVHLLVRHLPKIIFLHQRQHSHQLRPLILLHCDILDVIGHLVHHLVHLHVVYHVHLHVGHHVERW